MGVDWDREMWTGGGRAGQVYDGGRKGSIGCVRQAGRASVGRRTETRQVLHSQFL